jgi:hypothetical protein
MEEIQVEWPSGLKQQFQNLRSKRRYRLVEKGQLEKL